MEKLISNFSDRERSVRIYERSLDDREGWDYSHKYVIEKFTPETTMQRSYFQTFRQATDAMLIFFEEQGK